MTIWAKDSFGWTGWSPSQNLGELLPMYDVYDRASSSPAISCSASFTVASVAWIAEPSASLSSKNNSGRSDSGKNCC